MPKYVPTTEAERIAYNAGVLSAKEVLGNCFSGTPNTKMLRFAIDKAASYGRANSYVHSWYKSTQSEIDKLIK